MQLLPLRFGVYAIADSAWRIDCEDNLFLLYVQRWSFSESFCVRKLSTESAGHVAPKEPHEVDVPPISPSAWGFYWGLLAVSSTGKLLEDGKDDNVCSQVSSKSTTEKLNHSFPSRAP